MASYISRRIVAVVCLLGIVFTVNAFITVNLQPTISHASVSTSSAGLGAVVERRQRYPLFAIPPKDVNNNAFIEDESTDDKLQVDGITIPSLTPDIAYYYLQNTIGLSEEIMWKITLEAGSLLGMTPTNLENKVSLLRRTMNLSDEDVRVILAKQPAILHYSAERNLAPTILFLVRALDLSKAELRRMVMECPSILGYSLGNLKQKILFFMNTLGYYQGEESGKDRARELLVGTPKLLTAAVDTGLLPRMTFLRNEIQFSLEELRELYEKNPKLLLYSLDGNLREKIVFFFILQLQMEPKHVRKILLSYPQVMDYNLDNHMKPIAEYFMSDLDFSAVELRSIILKFPRLFTHSLVKIKHVVGFLRYELALDGQQVKRVVFQAPQILGLDTEGTLAEKVNFLRHGLELTEAELGTVLSKMPTLLCLGVSTNLMPKLEYLDEALAIAGSAHAVKDAVLKQPTLLGYSLDKRIRPRMEQLIAAGVNPTKITVGISMPEESFQEWLSSSQAKAFARGIVSEWNSTVAGFLCESLGFNDEDIQQLSTKLPHFIDWKVPTLRSRVHYLQDELFVEKDEFKKVLLAHPNLLDVSPEHGISDRLSQLQIAGIPLRDNIESLSWSKRKFVKWLLPKLQYSRSDIAFVQKKLGMSDAETAILLTKVPELEYKGNRRAVRDKLTYLIREFSNSTSDVRMLLLANPTTVNLSLSRTLKPRMKKMRMAGRITDPQTVATLLSMTNESFDVWWLPLKNKRTLTVLKKKYPVPITFLRTTLELKHKELDDLLLQIPEESLSSGNLMEVANMLFSVAKNSVERVKAVILEQPQLLSFTLKELDERTNARMESLHAIDAWAIDRVSVITMPDIAFERILSTKRVAYEKRVREKRARVVLSEVLNMSDDDVELILAHTNRVGVDDPDHVLLPKLKYLLSEFNGQKDDTAACLVSSPMILDYPLDEWIKPRMDMLRVAGVPPDVIRSAVSLTDTDIQLREELLIQLNLTDAELNQIAPLKTWLGDRRFRRSIGPTTKYLAAQLMNSASELKHIFLEDPAILTLSLNKQIKPRMKQLLEEGCHPREISSIVHLSQRKADEYLLRHHFCNSLGFTSEETSVIFDTAINTRQSPIELRVKVDYLLSEVFGGSNELLKLYLLQNQAILRPSLEGTIKPRVDTLNSLQRLGMKYSPTDVADLISKSKHAYDKDMIPTMNNWYPTVGDKRAERTLTSGEDGIESVIRSALHEFVPSFVFAYSDDMNRDNARVVHWR